MDVLKLLSCVDVYHGGHCEPGKLGVSSPLLPCGAWASNSGRHNQIFIFKTFLDLFCYKWSAFV